MPVINSITIIDNHAQPDGRKFCRFEFTLSTGDVERAFGYGKYDGDTDFDALRVQLSDKLDSHLIASEADRVLETTAPAQEIANLAHATTAQVVRRIFRRVLRENNLELMRDAYRIVQYIAVNYTAAQVRNFTGLSNAQLSKVQQRVDLYGTSRNWGAVTLEQIEESVNTEFTDLLEEVGD